MADKAAKKGKGKAGEKGKGEAKAEVPKEPIIPDGPKTYVVGGWSTVKQISAAIALADVTVGDKVAIMPGTYDEAVELNKDNLHIKGTADRAAVVLRRGVRSIALGGALQRVTVWGELEVERGNVAVTDCVVKGGKHGVVLHAVASPTIKDCLLCEQQVAAVYAFPHSRGAVEGCHLHGLALPHSTGVFADQSNTAFRNNDIRRQTTGVALQGECAGLLLQGNTISEIEGVGIHCSKGTKAKVKGNKVDSCKYYAILLEKAAAPTLERNVVEASSVAIRAGCKPALKLNQFTGRVVDENDTGNVRMQPAY